MRKGWITGTGLGTTEDAVRHMLTAIGEDPDRDGLKETPKRVIESWKELFAGYDQDPKDLFKVFDGEGYDQLVVLRDCPFTSFCEHHWLPFSGVAHVGYIPGNLNEIIGLSKLARLVDVFAKRLQVQERLTHQIAKCLVDNLKPLGAACVVKASHFCLACRGAKKPGAEMVTSSLFGVFRDDQKARDEFLQLAGL